jgi:hypothetical protein
MRKATRILLAVVAAAALLAVAPASRAQAPSTPAAASARVDPKADEAVRKMATFLAKVKSFTVEADETFDVEFARSYRVSLSNVRTITLVRPSKFVADARGDTLHRSSWYDGKSLTVLNRQANAYAVLDMPGTIDSVLDKLATDYEVFLPLSDVLYADPYATLMDGVLYGKYLGVHQAAGVPCHHLTFGQEDVEWQIWIDAGAQPLPRKLAMAYWSQTGVPTYQATFRRWALEPKLGAAEFQFVPPAGARKIEPAQLAALAR